MNDFYPDNVEKIKGLRDEAASQTASLQIVGRSLTDEEIKRVEGLNRIVLMCDEIIRILDESFPSLAATEDFTPSEAVSSVNWTERQAFFEVIKTIETHRAEIERIPGVISIRPGYRIANGDFTGVPAIVVSVMPGFPNQKSSDKFTVPQKINNVWVDVTPATPNEQLIYHQRQKALSESIEEIVIPAQTDEAIAQWNLILEGGVAPENEGFAEDFAAEAIPAKYIPPPDLSLDITTVDKMICHVSPDTGWELLSRFIADTKKTLTAAIYDFNAPYIEETLQTALQNNNGRMDLIIDKKLALKEKTLVDNLETALGNSFESTLASLGSGGIFSNAYHTKVAVRDSKAFWLSSGNWTFTSQPDLGINPNPHNLFSKGNREWNVIVEDKKLSETFENYIKYDISQAKEKSPGPEVLSPMPDLLIPIEDFGVEEAVTFQPAPFFPQTFEQVEVQPLLTPDNYIDHITSLIESASEKLYLQYSYIRFVTGNNKYKKLLNLICSKTNSNVDVKIIVSGNHDREDTEKLRAIGLDISCLRKQKSKLHNKGIIVDSKTVVVGSHNWSSSGTLTNRDASLIINNRDVTAYYEKIFMWDWNNLTSPTGAEEVIPIIATEETTPAGMVRVAWETFYEE